MTVIVTQHSVRNTEKLLTEMANTASIRETEVFLPILKQPEQCEVFGVKGFNRKLIQYPIQKHIFPYYVIRMTLQNLKGFAYVFFF